MNILTEPADQCGQGWAITAVSVAVDRTPLRECRLGKFFYGFFFDVLCDPHFEIAGIAAIIQRQSCENLYFFCTAASFLAHCRPTKVRVIEFNVTAKLMDCVPLAHCRTYSILKSDKIYQTDCTSILLCGILEEKRGVKSWRIRKTQKGSNLQEMVQS